MAQVIVNSDRLLDDCGGAKSKSILSGTSWPARIRCLALARYTHSHLRQNKAPPAPYEVALCFCVPW